MSGTPLFLETGAGQYKVQVHPVVVMEIIDLYSRRPNGQKRVVGTLFGTVSDGIVEVSDCFGIEHTDDGAEVTINDQHFAAVVEMHKKTSPNEQVVGWFATGSAINQSSVHIHEFYFKYMKQQPLHLTLETSPEVASKDGLIKAYISHSLKSTAEKAIGSYFHPLQCVITGSSMEKVAIAGLAKAMESNKGQPVVIAEADTVESSVSQLMQLLEGAIAYSKAVAEGKIKGDAKIGQELMEVVQLLPSLDTQELEKSFTESLQDLLMVAYLANLTRSQLALSEKLRRALSAASATPAAASSHQSSSHKTN